MDRKLIDYLPPVLRDVTEFKAINNANEPEISLAWSGLDRVMANQFLDDADERGVSVWEQELKIRPKDTDSLTVRKARVKALWNRERPYTLPWLRRWLTSICGPTGHEETIRDYTIDLRLDYTALPDASSLAAEILSALLAIRPCNMLIVPTAVLRPQKAHAVAGGAFVGARREIRTAVSVPALKPPGGRAGAGAYGGLRGSCGRLAVAVGGAQRARPPAGQGGAVCGARVLGVVQRVAVAVRGGPTMPPQNGI